MRKIATLLLLSWTVTACVSILPHKEYALAQSSLSRAKVFSADKLSPKTYLRAVSFYKKGQAQIRKKNYEEARNSFEEAVKWAEKAEFKARLRKKREF